MWQLKRYSHAILVALLFIMSYVTCLNNTHGSFYHLTRNGLKKKKTLNIFGAIKDISNILAHSIGPNPSYFVCKASLLFVQKV